MKHLLVLLLAGTCWFGRVTAVAPRDYDPVKGQYVTWQVFFQPLNGTRLYSALTWWSDYQIGDVLRICAGESYPWGEWRFTWLPVVTN